MIRNLIGKDLRVLYRARATLIALVLYPLVFAVIVTAVARDAGTRPRVALVDLDGVPGTVTVGGARVDYAALVADVRRRVNIVPMPLARARHELGSGGVVGVVIVPAGFIGALRTTITPPQIQLETRAGPVGERVLREVQSFVYELDSTLQRELLAENIGYLRVIVRGGDTEVLGRKVSILGLDDTATIIRRQQARAQDAGERQDLARILDFTHDATAALALAEPALRAVARPVTLRTVRRGGDDLFSSRGLAVVMAVGVVLAGVLLGAGSVAAERDEDTIGRLVRLPRALTQLVAAKIVFVVCVAVAIGAVLAVAAAGFADVAGGASAPWARLPAALVLLATGGAAIGAAGVLVGVLVRELAAAAFAALALALPFLLAGIVPHGTSRGLDLAGAAFPFAPAADGLARVLYDADPGRALMTTGLHLVLLALVYGLAARALAHRLAR